MEAKQKMFDKVKQRVDISPGYSHRQSGEIEYVT